MATVAEPYVRTPLFLLQSKFDHFQLEYIAGLRCMHDMPYDPPWVLPSCSAEEVDTIEAFGANLQRHMKPALERARSLRGVFLTSCVVHGQYSPSTWQQLTIDGESVQQAFSSWYLDDHNSRERDGKWIENCRLPCTQNPQVCAPWTRKKHPEDLRSTASLSHVDERCSPTCTRDVLRTVVDGAPCNAHLLWQQAEYGLTEHEACYTVAVQRPHGCSACMPQEEPAAAGVQAAPVEDVQAVSVEDVHSQSLLCYVIWGYAEYVTEALNNNVRYPAAHAMTSLDAEGLMRLRQEPLLAPMVMDVRNETHSAIQRFLDSYIHNSGNMFEIHGIVRFFAFEAMAQSHAKHFRYFVHMDVDVLLLPGAKPSLSRHWSHLTSHGLVTPNLKGTYFSAWRLSTLRKFNRFLIDTYRTDRGGLQAFIEDYGEMEKYQELLRLKPLKLQSEIRRWRNELLDFNERVPLGSNLALRSNQDAGPPVPDMTMNDMLLFRAFILKLRGHAFVSNWRGGMRDADMPFVLPLNSDYGLPDCSLPCEELLSKSNTTLHFQSGRCKAFMQGLLASECYHNFMGRAMV